jgi:hypothetical protein
LTNEADKDALIKDHLAKIMHLENRVDEEAFRAEAAENKLKEAQEDLKWARECLRMGKDGISP